LHDAATAGLDSGAKGASVGAVPVMAG